MYFKLIETSSAAKSLHNANQSRQAAERLRGLALKPSVRRAECAPNRKRARILAARLHDYEAMISYSSFKAPLGAYHKPGKV
jgi:hypothetical protein